MRKLSLRAWAGVILSLCWLGSLSFGNSVVWAQGVPGVEAPKGATLEELEAAPRDTAGMISGSGEESENAIKIGSPLPQEPVLYYEVQEGYPPQGSQGVFIFTLGWAVALAILVFAGALKLTSPFDELEQALNKKKLRNANSHDPAITVSVLPASPNVGDTPEQASEKPDTDEEPDYPVRVRTMRSSSAQAQIRNSAESAGVEVASADQVQRGSRAVPVLYPSLFDPVRSFRWPDPEAEELLPLCARKRGGVGLYVYKVEEGRGSEVLRRTTAALAAHLLQQREGRLFMLSTNCSGEDIVEHILETGWQTPREERLDKLRQGGRKLNRMMTRVLLYKGGEAELGSLMRKALDCRENGDGLAGIVLDMSLRYDLGYGAEAARERWFTDWADAAANCGLYVFLVDSAELLADLPRIDNLNEVLVVGGQAVELSETALPEKFPDGTVQA